VAPLMSNLQLHCKRLEMRVFFPGVRELSASSAKVSE
jgi:hypothetical protein